MEISKADFDAANLRGEESLAAFPKAVAVRLDRRIGRVVVSLASGLQLAFPPRLMQGLEHAKAADLADAQISPSGLGIYFPKLDADIWLPGLLEGFLGSKRWMASEMGKLGGQSASAAKQAAARSNGRLGGRPKKVAQAA
jgi:hypothetical protein